MSTLVENVQKVKNAHAALKTAIAAKGVAVPEGAKLTDMPALVEQIPSAPAQTESKFFYRQSGLDSIDIQNVVYVDFSKAQNIAGCFLDCSNLTSLALPDGFGQAATDLTHCFEGCSNLASLTLPAGFGQAATNLMYCFTGCKSLTSLTLPAGFGQAATDLYHCFRDCTSLTSLTLPDGFGQAATRLDFFISYCYLLTDINGNPNFKVSLNLSSCNKLTHDSLMVVINGLQTVTSTQTLKLGSTNLAKLTEADKKIATDKGWTLA